MKRWFGCISNRGREIKIGARGCAADLSDRDDEARVLQRREHRHGQQLTINEGSLFLAVLRRLTLRLFPIVCIDRGVLREGESAVTAF